MRQSRSDLPSALKSNGAGFFWKFAVRVTDGAKGTSVAEEDVAEESHAYPLKVQFLNLYPAEAVAVTACETPATTVLVPGAGVVVPEPETAIVSELL